MVAFWNVQSSALKKANARLRSNTYMPSRRIAQNATKGGAGVRLKASADKKKKVIPQDRGSQLDTTIPRRYTALGTPNIAIQTTALPPLHTLYTCGFRRQRRTRMPREHPTQGNKKQETNRSAIQLRHAPNTKLSGFVATTTNSRVDRVSDSVSASASSCCGSALALSLALGAFLSAGLGLLLLQLLLLPKLPLLMDRRQA